MGADRDCDVYSKDWVFCKSSEGAGWGRERLSRDREVRDHRVGQCKCRAGQPGLLVAIRKAAFGSPVGPVIRGPCLPHDGLKGWLSGPEL